MGLTKPIVALDEAPLDRAMMARIVASADPGMVLVGGQALAFWMDRYGIGPKEKPGAVFDIRVTTDADFLGSLAQAQRLAHALHATVIKPHPRAMTALVAQIKIDAGAGLAHNIDVMHQIFDAGGLRKSIELTARARQRAIKAETASGKVLQILHPLDVLASRIHNAAGLAQAKGAHVVTQVRWGIKVAHAAIERLAASDSASRERPGVLAQEVGRLALSRAGRVVYQQYGIETAEAIPFSLLLERVDGFKRQGDALLRGLQKHGRMLSPRF